MISLLQQRSLHRFLLFILLVTVNVSWSQSIWENPIDASSPSTSNPYTTGDIKDANITVSGIGRGTGINANAGSGRYAAAAWTTNAAIDANDYFTFTLTPNSGYKINFESLVFGLQRSSTGPATFSVRSSLDNYATSIQTIAASGTSVATKTTALSSATYQNITTAITFRVYGYAAGGGTGTASINDFVFNGTVVSTAAAPAISSMLTDSSVYNTSDTYTITASNSPTSYSASPLPTGASFAVDAITFSNTVAVGVYDITITATNAAGTDTETLVYTRSKADQTITFLPDPLPSKMVGDAPFALNSTASSGLAVSYLSSDTDIATISGNIVTIVGAGTSTITASQAGNANYNAATNVARVLTVDSAPSVVVTSVTPSGVLCNSTSNEIIVSFDTEGTSGGTFTVQHSGPSGVFPNDNIQNIIGTGNSPITATLPQGLAAGNYRIRVIHNATVNTYSAANSNDIVVNNNTWTGAADTNWNNAANWSCGAVPVAATPAVIDGSPLNQPVVNAFTANAKNLEIEAGASLLVVSGSVLNIQNSIAVATAGTLIIENNANLVQVNSALNTGQVTIHKNSLPLFRNDYTLWSSPVSGQNIFAFSPLTLTNRFYTYTPSSDNYATVANVQTATFDVAKGYLIRMPNTGSSGYNANTETLIFGGVFTGIPNNGNIPISLSTAGQGFNAVGNPYPSTLNFVDFIDANTAANDIEGQIWLWRKTNNSGNTSYATMTKAAYARNDAAGGGVDNSLIDPDTYELNVGQGFIVKSNTGNLIFNNAMRGNASNQPFFRTAANPVMQSRFWLNLTSVNGGFSQMAVAYRSDATLNYDNGLDGKNISVGNTSLYSFANGIPVVIQARPQFTDSDIVPLGFGLATAGQYSISIDNFDGLFATQDIFLKDNYSNTVHDIKAASYTFPSDAGTFDDRFEIIFVNSVLDTNTPVPDANTIIAYKANNELRIISGNTEMSEIVLYDLLGREIYRKSGITASEITITELPLADQVLILQVTTSENLKISKKILY